MTSALPDEAAMCSGGHAAVGRARVDVGAGLQQRLGQRRAARLGGQVQRRVLPDARHRGDVGAGVEQHVGQFGVAAFGGPVQRAHAVALRAVDVGALLEQVADGGLVAAHRRIGDRRDLLLRAERGGENQGDHQIE